MFTPVKETGNYGQPDFIPLRQRHDYPRNRRTFKEMYVADVSPTLISKVTDAVKEQVTEWQNRRLAMSRFFIEFDDRLSDHL